MTELIVVRFTPEQYRVLERSLAPPAVTNATTELMAGYQLGIQTVLKTLREGYTIGEG